jgi:hypothetical protein
MAELTFYINGDGYVTEVTPWDYQGDIVVPEYIDGVQVTGIDSYAFSQN